MTYPQTPSRRGWSASTGQGPVPMPMPPAGSGAAAGWTPPMRPPGPPGWPPPGAAPPSGPPSGSPRRRWMIAAATVLAAAAVALTLVFTLGGHATTAGRAVPSADTSGAVVNAFIALETARYNAPSATVDSAPQPNAAAYARVSCKQDLAEMRNDGSGPPPPSPPVGPLRFTFAIVNITPTKDSRLVLRLARTVVATQDVGDGLFYVQKESGAWKVCGLFSDTEPPDPSAGGGSAGSGGSGQPSPSDNGSGAGAGSAPAQTVANGPRGFLDGVVQAINQGLVGTAAQAVCLGDPGSLNVVEGWISAHDQVAVQSLDTIAASGTTPARLQVTPPGQASATYTAAVQPSGSVQGGPCLAQIQQS